MHTTDARIGQNGGEAGGGAASGEVVKKEHEAMRPLILAAVFILALASPALTDTTHCTTREDAQAQRWATTCTDGSRAVSRYDMQAQRWRTDILRAPKGDKAP